VARLADGYVLADVQTEVAAAGRKHECARDRWGSDDLAVHETLDMLQHRISVVLVSLSPVQASLFSNTE